MRKSRFSNQQYQKNSLACSSAFPLYYLNTLAKLSLTHSLFSLSISFDLMLASVLLPPLKSYMILKQAYILLLSCLSLAKQSHDSQVQSSIQTLPRAYTRENQALWWRKVLMLMVVVVLSLVPHSLKIISYFVTIMDAYLCTSNIHTYIFSTQAKKIDAYTVDCFCVRSCCYRCLHFLSIWTRPSPSLARKIFSLLLSYSFNLLTLLD